MLRSNWMTECVLLSGTLAVSLSLSVACAQTDENLAEQVDRLVRQMDDEETELRDEAEKQLLQLAPQDDEKAIEAFLALLPHPIEGMPTDVQKRLRRAREAIVAKQLGNKLQASRVTLHVDAVELAEVLRQIRTQTGNQLEDRREQFGQEAKRKRITAEFEDVEFWPAVDEILDQARMDPYSLSGEDVLALVGRELGSQGRIGRASYAGPFRVEAVNIALQRSLRNPLEDYARIELEIAWEPRLKPLALSQLVANVKVTADDDQAINLSSQRESLDVEVQPGSHSTQLIVPIELPERRISKLSHVQGEILALVPGRHAEFQFDKLDEALGVEQQQGGVKLSVQRVWENHGLWEVHMQVELLSEVAALQSHRDWLFQNITYLVDKEGQELDHAGFETTLQTERSLGLAYFFELPENADISSYTWVYRTPASIVEIPVAYDLRDIPLP